MNFSSILKYDNKIGIIQIAFIEVNFSNIIQAYFSDRKYIVSIQSCITYFDTDCYYEKKNF